MKKLAIIQPSYIPWRGFFDIINQVDVFVFYDDVQYERRSWRNRNKIKTSNGTKWLSVPVKTKGKYNALINEVLIDYDRDWQKDHIRSIYHNYCKSTYFEKYFPLIVKILEKPWTTISELDIEMTKLLANELGIRVQWEKSSDYVFDGTKTKRLINVCKEFGADYYLSGPSARDYIEPELFNEASIDLSYQNYNYPEYTQQFGEFEPFVSVVDLLFNCGENAPDYIWGSGKIGK